MQLTKRLLVIFNLGITVAFAQEQCNFPIERKPPYKGINPYLRDEYIKIPGYQDNDTEFEDSSVLATNINESFGIIKTHAAHIIPYADIIKIWDFALWSTDTINGGNVEVLTPAQLTLLTALKDKINAIDKSKLSQYVDKNEAIAVINKLLSGEIVINGGTDGKCSEKLKPLLNFVAYAGFNIFISPELTGNLHNSPGGRAWDPGNELDVYGKYTKENGPLIIDTLLFIKKLSATKDKKTEVATMLTDLVNGKYNTITHNSGMEIDAIQTGFNKWVKVSSNVAGGTVPKTCPKDLAKISIAKCFNPSK